MVFSSSFISVSYALSCYLFQYLLYLVLRELLSARPSFVIVIYSLRWFRITKNYYDWYAKHRIVKIMRKLHDPKLFIAQIRRNQISVKLNESDYCPNKFPKKIWETDHSRQSNTVVISLCLIYCWAISTNKSKEPYGRKDDTRDKKT